MVTLAIERSGSAELTYQIVKDAISIGAASQNDIVIRSPGVAPRHLVIQRNGDVFTFLVERRQIVVLNGERRSRGVLRVGDRLRIGTAVVIFKGFESDEIEVDAPPPEQVVEQEAPTSLAAPVGRTSGGRGRAEMVLYSEPSRIAQARRKMVEIFRSGVQADLLPPLRGFFEAFFKDRQIMLSWVDEQGHFQPIASAWSGEVPRLPARTFDELGRGGRFAHLHLGGRQVLIYPIDHGALQAPAFVVAETHPEAVSDDELIVAELARMLAIHWERVEQSGSLYGPWEAEARRTAEQRLPGTSHAIQVLRDGVIVAARSPHPVLLCGVPGSGRMTCAALVASLHPTGPLQVHVFQCRDADVSALRGELFGATEGDPLGGGLVGRARGGVLVARDVHRLPVSLQREMTAAIRYDVEGGYGPSVRWMATTGEDALSLVNEGVLDSELFNLFQKHLTRVPSLHERREDLPLLIVGLLDSLAAEQGKRVRGIELETLNSLLLHPFAGEMAELVAEVRRLVSATPDGEMVRGRVPIAAPSRVAGDEEVEDLVSGTDLLAVDDLKVVIPGIEHIIIDRVLRRTKGNQSKAARILNLSRGALIAKMKEYSVPDYRYLRRR